MAIKDHLEKLQGLYSKTGMDWDLTITHCLTEPTCPCATIAPEGSNATRYSVVANTIEEAIAESAERVYREIILGQKIEPSFPFSNPDDNNPEMPWNKHKQEMIDSLNRSQEQLKAGETVPIAPFMERLDNSIKNCQNKRANDI